MNLPKLLFILFVSQFLWSCELPNNIEPNSPLFLDSLQNDSISISFFRPYIDSENDFGFKIFQDISRNNIKNENIFISPSSISISLGIVLNGAEGTTQNEIRSCLNKNEYSISQINTSNYSLSNYISYNDDNTFLQIANGIFYKNTCNINSNFTDSSYIYYGADATPLDFTNSESVNYINKWIANNTNNKITSIVNQINEDDVMYIVNAIYFKSAWKKEFNSELTSLRPFKNIGNVETEVTTMYTIDTCLYYKHNEFTMLQLPYSGDRFNMTVIVPNENSSVIDFINSISVSNWDNWISNLTPYNIEAYIPKFSFNYNSSLKYILKNLGIKSAFSPQANFNNINSNNNIYISEVIHKTQIDVSEIGTEAAAITSASAKENTTVFKVDRPFVFAITEKTTGSIIFLGSILHL